jgi:hypothetical protein
MICSFIQQPEVTILAVADDGHLSFPPRQWTDLGITQQIAAVYKPEQ